jgi:hypothetical protein
VLRIGKIFSSYRNLLRDIKSSTCLNLSTSLKCFAHISGGFYLFIDHFILFLKIKSIQLNSEIAKKIDFFGNILWMIQTISTIFYQVIDLGELNKEHFVVYKKLLSVSDINSEGMLVYD